MIQIPDNPDEPLTIGKAVEKLNSALAGVELPDGVEYVTDVEFEPCYAAATGQPITLDSDSRLLVKRTTTGDLYALRSFKSSMCAPQWGGLYPEEQRAIVARLIEHATVETERFTLQHKPDCVSTSWRPSMNAALVGDFGGGHLIDIYHRYTGPMPE